MFPEVDFRIHGQEGLVTSVEESHHKPVTVLSVGSAFSGHYRGFILAGVRSTTLQKWLDFLLQDFRKEVRRVPEAIRCEPCK